MTDYNGRFEQVVQYFFEDDNNSRDQAKRSSSTKIKEEMKEFHPRSQV